MDTHGIRGIQSMGIHCSFKTPQVNLPNPKCAACKDLESEPVSGQKSESVGVAVPVPGTRMDAADKLLAEELKKNEDRKHVAPAPASVAASTIVSKNEAQGLARTGNTYISELWF